MYLKPPADFKSVPSDTLNVAWGLRRENHLEPLVLFSYLSLLYVYDIKNKAIVSCLRGHGGVRFLNFRSSCPE